MSQFGHVSAVNLSRQCNMCTVLSPQHGSSIGNGISFAVSDAIGHKLRMPTTHAFSKRSNRNMHPLKVVCIDYPRPELENTVNFLDAARLSSTFRTSLVQASRWKL